MYKHKTQEMATEKRKTIQRQHFHIKKNERNPNQTFETQRHLIIHRNFIYLIVLFPLHQIT